MIGDAACDDRDIAGRLEPGVAWAWRCLLRPPLESQDAIANYAVVHIDLEVTNYGYSLRREQRTEIVYDYLVLHDTPSIAETRVVKAMLNYANTHQPLQ